MLKGCKSSARSSLCEAPDKMNFAVLRQLEHYHETLYIPLRRVQSAFIGTSTITRARPADIIPVKEHGALLGLLLALQVPVMMSLM